MEQTLSAKTTTTALIFIPAFMLSLGTGYAVTPETVRKFENGRRYEIIRPHHPATEAANDAANPFDQIALARSTLKLSVQDLTDALGVSRQAFYNWKAGSDLKPENAAKVANLVAAAAVIAESGIPRNQLTLGRKLPGGRTLLESIAQDADGRDAAKALVAMIEKEQLQREKLSARLAEKG